jgi:hypothetical protein
MLRKKSYKSDTFFSYQLTVNNKTLFMPATQYFQLSIINDPFRKSDKSNTSLHVFEL